MSYFDIENRSINQWQRRPDKMFLVERLVWQAVRVKAALLANQARSKQRAHPTTPKTGACVQLQDNFENTKSRFSDS